MVLLTCLSKSGSDDVKKKSSVPSSREKLAGQVASLLQIKLRKQKVRSNFSFLLDYFFPFLVD